MISISNCDQFDYSSLDGEVRIVVRQRTSEIKSLMRRTVEYIIEIGQKLMEVKTYLGHGNFLKWLEHEFEWQERSARNFMRVAEAFKTVNFADLDFAVSALYLLAAPSVPEQVRQTALELANRGETITYSKAKDMVRGYRRSPKLTNEVKTIDNTSIVLAQSPLVAVLGQTDSELKIEIIYADVNLNLTGDKNSLISFLKQIQANSNLTDDIIQRIKSQTK